MQENEMIKMLDLNADRYIYTKHQLFKIFENLPNKCPKNECPKKMSKQISQKINQKPIEAKIN